MKHLLLLITVLSTMSAQAAPKHHVSIVIYAGIDETEGFGNPDLDKGYLIRDMRALNPGTDVWTIDAYSNAHVQNALKAMITDNVVVDAVYIDSHGNSSPEPGGNCSAMISNTSVNFYVDVTSQYALEHVFGALKGHMAERSSVIFSACLLLAACDNNKLRFNALNTVAKAFDIKTGSIYMNETRGQDSFRRGYMQPFYEQPGNAGKAESLVKQAFPYFGLPITLAVDHLILNQGYTLKLDEDGKFLMRDKLPTARSVKRHYSARGDIDDRNVVAVARPSVHRVFFATTAPSQSAPVPKKPGSR